MFTTPQAASPTPPIVSVFRRGGLRCRRLTAPNRDLIATKRGNCTIRGATRRRHAVARLLMLQNPHHYSNRVRLRHPRAQGPGGLSMVTPGIGRAAPTSARVRPRHPLTRSWGAIHRPAMQYKQERGKHDQLEYRLSRTRKPKSHPSSNTWCPITQLQYRLSRINKPKSRHNTNTFCPITPPLRLGAGWGIKNRPGHCAHGR